MLPQALRAGSRFPVEVRAEVVGLHKCEGSPKFPTGDYWKTTDTAAKADCVLPPGRHERSAERGTPRRPLEGLSDREGAEQQEGCRARPRPDAQADVSATAIASATGRAKMRARCRVLSRHSVRQPYCVHEWRGAGLPAR
jgi:hypothetical protein